MKPSRIAVAAFAVCIAALPSFGADRTPADAVLQAVARAAAGTVQRYGVAPAAWSTTTRAGAAHSADEFAWVHFGNLLATELADSYYNENRTEHPIELSPKVLAIDVHPFASGNTFDWAKLNEKYPRVQSVVLISEPGFDSLGTTALVRYDVVSPNRSWTAFDELERQPADGSWKMKMGTIGDRDITYRDDVHPNHTPKECPVPADKRHTDAR